MDLTNKVAIVTGSGGGGSGRAEACRFGREGCFVLVSDIDEGGGRQTLDLIEAAGGTAAFFRADVAIESEVKALIAFAEGRFGGVDIIVNNASGPGYHPEVPLEYWFETVQIDLLGAMYGTRYGIEAMRRRGGGAIVNIGSTSALPHGNSRAPGYDIAKMGVIRLTTTLGWLGEREGIRVNCLVPDWVASPEVKAYFDSLTPEQRKKGGVPDVLTTLDEISDAVLELVTNEKLAGRVMVLWSGKPPRLIPFGDPGYEGLE
jgi:NAD(P)-dependent dehydrogenase (short-subunit alcohol dehydrogenase family)